MNDMVLTVARCTYRERSEAERKEWLCGERGITYCPSDSEARCYDHAKMCEVCHQPSVYGTHDSHPADWPSLR